MVKEILAPGVQHAEKTDLGTEVFRIGGDLQQAIALARNNSPYRIFLFRVLHPPA